MRAGITVKVTPDDRRRLEAIVSDRNAPQKHVWRAKIILATADGCGTSEIMRPIRQGQAGGVALAGSFHGRRRRQDAQTRQAAAAGGHGAVSGRFGALCAAGRSQPLDRPDAGEGSGREFAIGATHP